eukprot:jgi/Psemu1/28342/gm1.28342_g
MTLNWTRSTTPKRPPAVGSARRGTSLPKCDRTIAAANILRWSAYSSVGMTTALAMVHGGFTEEESKNKSLQKRVLRQKKKIIRSSNDERPKAKENGRKAHPQVPSPDSPVPSPDPPRPPSPTNSIII